MKGHQSMTKHTGYFFLQRCDAPDVLEVQVHFLRWIWGRYWLLAKFVQSTWYLIQPRLRPLWSVTWVPCCSWTWPWRTILNQHLKEPVRIKTAGGTRNRVLRRDETDGDYGQGAKNPIDWRATTCEANSFKLQRWLQTVIRYGYIANTSIVISIILAHIVCGVFIFMFFKEMFTTKERRAIAFVRIWCSISIVYKHESILWGVPCLPVDTAVHLVMRNKIQSNPVYFSVSPETFDSHERICQVDHPQCASAYFPQTFP